MITQIPNSIQERLLKNSSNEEIIDTAKCEYEDALKKSGFKADFKYTKNQQQKPKNRSRNIFWFHPPFKKAVSTNNAKVFLQLINRHFSKSHRPHKIFNRNKLKVSSDTKLGKRNRQTAASMSQWVVLMEQKYVN